MEHWTDTHLNELASMIGIGEVSLI